MILDIDRAYTAGFIDGEGSILLTRNKAGEHRSPVVSVSNTCKPILDYLQDTWGGHIVTHKVYKSHHKQSWIWMLKANKAIDFLNEILPFLREDDKVYRARLIVNEYKSVTVSCGRYSEEQAELKSDFENRFYNP